MGGVQLPLGIRLRDACVFESYFSGRNQATVAALEMLVDAPLESKLAPTCVWVHGPSGSGKTHLLQAMCARAGERAAAYLPLREASGASEEQLSGLGRLAFVCLDDAEAIAGQPAWERALFGLHQELDEHGGRLIAAGSAPPMQLAFRLRDLASRLNGGLVLTLHALDDDEQVSALRLRAQLRGFDLPEDTARFMMRRLPRNMTRLCRFLDELDRASLIEQRRLTVPFVKRVMSEE